MMRTRRLTACLIAICVAFACSSEKRGEKPAKGPLISTREIREGLARDVGASDRDLTALQDSIYRFLGDTIAVLLKRARTRWDEYRQLECDAVRLAFAHGSMASVAESDCWVELTDDRRHFLGDEYNFVHGTPSPAASRAP
jgi:uncharacterized protein YecT (DUF1311 family)